MWTLWRVTLYVLLLGELQFLTKASHLNRYTVTCRNADMFTVISKDFNQSTPTFIYVQDRHGKYHNAREIAAQCLYGITETPRFLIFYASYSSCHVQNQIRDGNITFWVNIVAQTTCHSSQGPALREAPFILTASCTYILANASSDRSPKVRIPRSANVPTPKNVGVLRAQMRFATDSSFRSFYKGHGAPVLRVLGEPVFVEVFVLKREDKDLVLVLNECWATPSPDPDDEYRWNLLHRGCPLQVDGTSVEILDVRHGNGLKYPNLHKRLKMNMFTFVATEDLFKEVYLHCDAEVCKGAHCMRTCTRKRRESAVKRNQTKRSIIQHEIVSGGPLNFTV